MINKVLAATLGVITGVVVAVVLTRLIIGIVLCREHTTGGKHETGR